MNEVIKLFTLSVSILVSKFQSFLLLPSSLFCVIGFTESIKVSTCQSEWSYFLQDPAMLHIFSTELACTLFLEVPLMYTIAK